MKIVLVIGVVVIEWKYFVNLMLVYVIKSRNNSFIFLNWELKIISLIGFFAKGNLVHQTTKAIETLDNPEKTVNLRAIKRKNGMVDNSTIKLSSTTRRLLVFLMLLLQLCPSMYGQTKRALLVGISDYATSTSSARGQWGNIHGANDVELISKTLKQQGFKITSITNKKATARAIRSGLKSLTKSCRKGDVVYIHFSCHGQPFEDKNGDEEDGWDESIVPCDALKKYQKGKYEGANHILDDELHTYFQKIRQAIGPKGFLCVVIDACHAGSMYMGVEEEDEEFFRGTKDGFSPNGKIYQPRINTKGHFVIKSSSGQGEILILEACPSYQTNHEIKKDGRFYGPLSYFVNKALSSQPLAPNLKWVNEVERLMSDEPQVKRHRQTMVRETSLK